MRISYNNSFIIYASGLLSQLILFPQTGIPAGVERQGSLSTLTKEVTEKACRLWSSASDSFGSLFTKTKGAFSGIGIPEGKAGTG